ncbi:MAG: hypothetical protein JWM08_592 [Candidatus Angelobacter sp.]|nr:hypothetical protein [Candidatus Angelobacter sp.]
MGLPLLEVWIAFAIRRSDLSHSGGGRFWKVLKSYLNCMGSRSRRNCL